MGFALLSSPTTRGSWNNRLENAAISVNLTNYGNWYAKYYDGTTVNAVTSTGTNNIGGSTTYKNFVFTCLLTAPNRMNITITDGTTTSNLFDLLLNNSGPITEYSTYLSDDWDGNGHFNIFWNTNGSADADYVKNTLTMPIGSSNGSFTIGGVLANGLAANSTSTESINTLTKTGTGSLTLSNASNSYSGGTVIQGGTVSVSNAGHLGNTSGAITIGNSSTSTTLDVTSTLSRTALNVIDGSSAGVINVASGQTFTITNLNTPSGTSNTTKFGKSGPGTLTLSGSGTYTGQTQIGDGSVIVSNNSGLGTNNTTGNRGVDLGLNVADVSQANNVSLLATNGITVPQSIYVAPNTSSATRTIGLGGSGTATFSNEIFMGGNLTVSGGSGTLTLGGRLTSTGGIIASTGIVNLTASNNNFSGSTTVNSGAELRLNPSTNATYASQVVLDGGTLSTTGITATRTFTSSGSLNLSASSASTIALGLSLIHI